MKKIITLLASVLMFAQFSAQNYQWSAGYDGSFSISNVEVLNCPNNNGGVMTVLNYRDSVNFDPANPTSFHVSPGGYGISISKLDANGNLVFNQIIELTYYEHHYVYDVQVLSDNSYYLIASHRNASYPLDIDPGTGTYNVDGNSVTISHFDATGNLLSVKNLNIETFKFGLFGTDLNANDELLISGEVYYGAHFSNIPSQDTTYANNVRRVFAAKYDNNLDIVWSDFFENHKPTLYSNTSYGNAVLKPNGKTVVTYSFGSSITLANTNNYSPSGTYDVVLIAYDVSGAILNDYTISTAGVNDQVISLAADANNNLAITGKNGGSFDMDFEGTFGGVSTASNTYIATYDDAFSLTNIISGSSGNTSFKAAAFASNGDLIVGGKLFNSFDFDFQPFGDQFYNLTSAGGYDLFLAKYDATLNVIYAHNIGNSVSAGDVKHLRLNGTDDIFFSGELGTGANDMNFGPQTNNLTFGGTGGFIGKYNLCNTTEVIENVGVCPGDSYTFPDGTSNNNINSPISYTARIVGGTSCDSIIITNITLNPEYSILDTVEICEGSDYTHPDGFVEMNITTQTSHINILQTVEGCDSIINRTVKLILLPQIATQPVGATICDESSGSMFVTASNVNDYTWFNNDNDTIGVNNDTLSSPSIALADSGLYYVALSNQCATVYSDTVRLEIIGIDITTIINGFDISSNQAGATYQWIDCNNMSEIMGATSQSYTAINNSDNAVVINFNGCVDTSDCVNINIVGFDNPQSSINNIKLFPNPAKEKFEIKNFKFPITNIVIHNVAGKVVKTISPTRGAIDISKLTKGIYFVSIESNSQQKVIKLIKE